MGNDYVTFDEPGGDYRTSYATGGKQSALTQVVIKMGLAKDARQAGVVLIILGIAAVALMWLLWPSSSEQIHVPQPGEPGYERLG